MDIGNWIGRGIPGKGTYSSWVRSESSVCTRKQTPPATKKILAGYIYYYKGQKVMTDQTKGPLADII